LTGASDILKRQYPRRMCVGVEAVHELLDRATGQVHQIEIIMNRMFAHNPVNPVNPVHPARKRTCTSASILLFARTHPSPSNGRTSARQQPARQTQSRLPHGIAPEIRVGLYSFTRSSTIDDGGDGGGDDATSGLCS